MKNNRITSEQVGCIPTVLSKSSLVAPNFIATAYPYFIYKYLGYFACMWPQIMETYYSIVVLFIYY